MWNKIKQFETLGKPSILYINFVYYYNNNVILDGCHAENKNGEV